jgi:small ligand-binding sensory domain FIST
MKWASTIATTARLEDAVEEAGEALISELGGASADLVIAFVSTEYADHISRLAETVREIFGDALLFGCTAGGVIGGGVEAEREPALSLTAAHLPGVDIQPFHLDRDSAQWREQIGVSEEQDPCFVLLPDPFTFSAEELLDWCDREFPGAPKIGGLASGATYPGGNALFLGDEIFRTGAIGLALHGNVQLQTVVAQGCRPIGSPMFVTRAEGNVLFQLDGQRAISILESLYAGLSPRDQELFRTSLFLGLVMDPEQQEYAHGDFLVRNILGIDPKSDAIAIGADLEQGQIVQFHLRDAETSATDLEMMLRATPGRAPSGALLFSCLGRGVGLYGEPNHDSNKFAEQHGAVALGGFFCNGEIGPVHGHTFLHGYTSSFGLFRPKQ